MRFLPSTLVIIVVGPDRRAPDRPHRAAAADDRSGLLLERRLAVLAGRIDDDTSYGFLLPAFVLMGLGMGLVMSPMSTAAMNAVDRAKAGVASGTLSMSRMVGGTFGVAAMGALITGLGRSRLADLLPGLPAEQRERIAESLGAGAAADCPSASTSAAEEAFVSALNSGLRLAALLAVVGAGSPGP